MNTIPFCDECKCVNDAAKSGHLRCLKYLHENRCSSDKSIWIVAVEKGHLDVLKYLHENGCPWHEWGCERAAKYGHLDCLQYLHENGCPCGHRRNR